MDAGVVGARRRARYSVDAPLLMGLIDVVKSGCSSYCRCQEVATEAKHGQI